ncbi:polysaccharide pyruvyl transferase family protein [Nocardioides sp. KR10-350]|uniref:polysaccharide pyruvyl transferase family protein n=1 Tax=Nocardioides cheoyonin TaxID=3156615 RepID=UPI0032B53371
MPAHIVHWNPRRLPLPGRLSEMFRVGPRVNNFGDVLGPVLVDAILRERGLDPAAGRGRVLTVGSIMHYSQPGDVVWGSGVNPKSGDDLGGAPGLDVRAVRGPRTREVLQSVGTTVPEVYGDPGLLWSRFFPRESYTAGRTTRPVTIVPNMHDWSGFAHDPRAVSPRRPVHDVIAQIASSELVVGSSLHGVVVAESFGIPARLVVGGTEPGFKYDDYYRGTGRPAYETASSVDEAIALGGEKPPVWDPEPLLAAFPADLWR